MMRLAAVPIRVDFAGGWLDVPRLAVPGAFVVNGAFSPMVSLARWPYERPGAGLGGSAAYAILQGRDPIAAEIEIGAGWQDPAVILETGLCAWRSGPWPVLEVKVNSDFLAGRLGLLWTGRPHYTPELAGRPRDYGTICRAAAVGTAGVSRRSIDALIRAVQISYRTQLTEGMDALPDVQRSVARKYCGGGWGGYAVYMFRTPADRDASGLVPIEPYLRGVQCST
jgi:hypothetical protein